MSEGKAVIIKADMPKEMQEDAVDCATQAMGKSTDDGEVARYIQGQFNKKYDRRWHCIVGRHFASYVYNDKNCYIVFDMSENRILLFKSG